MYVISFPTLVIYIVLYMYYFFIVFGFFFRVYTDNDFTLVYHRHWYTSRWTETNGRRREEQEQKTWSGEIKNTFIHSFMREWRRIQQRFDSHLKIILANIVFSNQIYLSSNRRRKREWMRIFFIFVVVVLFFSIVDWSGSLLLSTRKSSIVFFWFLIHCFGFNS